MVQALSGLFERHGPPLVLERDGGSGLSSDPVDLLLGFYGVLALPSPPYTTRYNSSAEAGVGSTKTRTERRAAAADHPGWWTCDDLEGARL